MSRRSSGIGVHLRATIALLAAALVIAGCGARWSDEQAEQVLSRGASTAAGSPTAGNGVVSPGEVGSTDGPDASGTSAGSDVAADASASAPGAEGARDADGEDVAGGSGGALPCAAASDAPGVTDSKITIATIQSLSGPVPGLGQSNLDAVRAHVAFRNATGGVCGRELVLKSADDGIDAGRYRSTLAELEPAILALVTGVAGGADGGVDVAEAANLPLVGSTVTTGLVDSPVYWGLNVPLDSYDRIVGKYRYLTSKGVSKAAVVYINAAAAPLQASQEMQLMRAAGIKVVNEQPLPLSTISYDSAARAVANSGADYLFMLHDQTGSAAMARAVTDTGYQGLKFEEYIVAHGSRFPELAKSSAQGASTWLYALPVEDGGKVPEHARFLDWIRRVAPDTNIDTFAAQGWASAKLLMDTLEALPGPLSRDAILAQLRATGIYDAGGLYGPVDIGGRELKNCQIGMIYEGSGWKRIAPASGFLC